MKKLLLLPALLFLTSFSGICQVKLLTEDCPIAAKYSVLQWMNVEAPSTPLKDGETVEIGQPIGRTAPYPKVLSKVYQKEIEQSKALYEQRQFAQAASVLKEAVLKESGNPFVLEPYARALYQIDSKKPESYVYYKKLITLLDDQVQDKSVLLLNPWFMEAYWKLGTLHMDNEKWEPAMLEIGRFMIIIQNQKEHPVYEQALSYLTECAYMMKDAKLCQHFGARTLALNPANDYVKEYLAELNK